MYVELKSVNVWTMIKTWFFLNLVIGIGMGLVYSMISLFTLTAATEFLILQGFDPSVIDPITLMILMPILFGCGNAIFGTMLVAILSIVYNITGRLFGGLQFELVADEEEEEIDVPIEPSQPVSTPAAASAGTAAAASVAASTEPDPETGYAPPPPPPPSPEVAQAARKASRNMPAPPPPQAQSVEPDHPVELDHPVEPDKPGPVERATIPPVGEKPKPMSEDGNEDDTDPMLKIDSPLGSEPQSPTRTEPPTPAGSPTRAEPPAPAGSPTPPPERTTLPPWPDRPEQESDDSEGTSDEEKRRNDQP